MAYAWDMPNETHDDVPDRMALVLEHREFPVLMPENWSWRRFVLYLGLLVFAWTCFYVAFGGFDS